MKWYWKIIITLLSIAALILILDISFNLWIRFQLPKIINEQNDSAYSVTYKELSISLLNSSINAEDIVLVPKAALKDTVNKAGIYAKIKSVDVVEFKIWPMVFGDKIKARSVIVNTPTVILYKKNDKAIGHSKSISSGVVAPFGKIISVPDITLKHGDLKIIQTKTNKALLSVQNINFRIRGVLITDKVLQEKIPFHFSDYDLSCDSLYYRSSEFYHIKTRQIKTTKTDLEIDHLEMIPEYTRREFVQKIPKQKDLYTLHSESIAIQKIDWGFQPAGDFFFHAKLLKINNAAANIYRSLIPMEDKEKKNLYSKMLRELKFDLKIDTLQLSNSILEYEEEKSFDRGAGKITMNKFNVTATNICSGFKKQKLEDLKIKINCLFMKTSPLSVNWVFNVMNISDSFHIKGTLRNFEAEQLTPFSKPYMNLTAKGILDEIHFDFTGNNKSDSGDLGVKYDDLKFSVYKKTDRKKKSKLKTLLVNLFVKNDSKNKIKDTHVEADRVPEKSFFNFLWRTILKGLEKILI